MNLSDFFSAMVTRTEKSSIFTVEDWPLERIIPYHKNARRKSQKAVEKLARSIEQFGVRQPIVVDEDGIILVGHTRRDAAQLLGMSSFPVHQALDLTEGQKKAYRLADNRTHDETSWDPDILGSELLDLKSLAVDLESTGFESLEIVRNISSAFDVPLADVPFRPHEFEPSQLSQNKPSADGAGRQSKRGKADSREKLEFRVIVDCENEEQQTELLERFKAENLKCRALIS